LPSQCFDLWRVDIGVGKKDVLSQIGFPHLSNEYWAHLQIRHAKDKKFPSSICNKGDQYYDAPLGNYESREYPFFHSLEGLADELNATQNRTKNEANEADLNCQSSSAKKGYQQKLWREKPDCAQLSVRNHRNRDGGRGIS
jgi:hypothetical protein